ncbi:MAG TPA: small, acid-soluble spore protein, alpha/beta type [Bacillota bacterium]|jgi:small acid-soluble spore protein F (minor alpha/beta-type SASP)
MAQGQSDKQVMSDRLKMELARELGVAAIVEREGWGAVPAKDCGRLVKLAVERAERLLQGSGR